MFFDSLRLCPFFPSFLPSFFFFSFSSRVLLLFFFVLPGNNQKDVFAFSFFATYKNDLTRLRRVRRRGENEKKKRENAAKFAEWNTRPIRHDVAAAASFHNVRIFFVSSFHFSSGAVQQPFFSSFRKEKEADLIEEGN